MPVAGTVFWLGLALVSAGATVLSVRWTATRLVSLARLSRYAAAATLAVSAGGVREAQFGAPEPTDVGFLASGASERVLTLYGASIATPVERDGRARFVLEVDSVSRSGGPPFHPATGRAYVSVRESRPDGWIDGARAGMRLAVRGVLHEPYQRGNPADFDFRRYLLRRSVRAIIRVDDATAIHSLDPPSSLIRRVSLQVERLVERTLDRRIQTHGGRAILVALLLGRRGEMDPDVLAHFSRTGLLHILAVSGLHVLMVGMIAYGLLCPILLRLGFRWRMMEVTRALTTLVLLTVYALVTGGSASVTRAVIMTGVLIGGVAFQRTSSSLNSLAVAGCVLLLQRPTYLWDVGFQLSFSAVAAIVLLQRPLAPLITERFDVDGWRAKLAGGMVTTTAATLGTAPVLLYHFGSVSIAGLLLNPVAIPASGLALSSGLLCVTTAAIPWLSAAFGHAADFYANVLIQTAAVGDHLFGWARVERRVTHPPFVMGLILLTGGLAFLNVPRLRWRASIAALLMFCAGIWAGLLGDRSKPALEALFLDVGQGDAALIRFPNGKHLAVDLGPRDDYRDAGSSVIVPHLEWWGVRRLDAVVVTHPHADHLGGLPSVLRNTPVSRLVTAGDSYDSELVTETDFLSDSLSIASSVVAAGDTLHFDDRVRVYVLGPTPIARANSDPNERSVVLRIEYGSTSMLLTGDAEGASERELLTHFPEALAADVVKVAHHGSRTSSHERFVRAASPPGSRTIAVVSVGRRNRFGLPDEDVLERWQEAGARVHMTSSNGALWIRTDGRTIEEIPWTR